MATRMIVTCDLCKSEIKTAPFRVSAARYPSEFVLEEQRLEGMSIGAQYTVGKPVAELNGEFCSEGCVITAVRGLLNGAA